MTKGRVEELEAALQTALNLLVPTNDAGLDAQKKLVKTLASRQVPRHQWISRDELLEALDEVPTPTAKALAKVLRRE